MQETNINVCPLILTRTDAIHASLDINQTVTLEYNGQNFKLYKEKVKYLSKNVKLINR